MKTGKVQQKWRRRLISWSGQLLLILLLLLGLEAFLSRDAVGTVAPNIEATTIEGEAFSLAQLRGKAAIVHFWATWCPICELEITTVDALAVEAPVITVAMQSGGTREVRSYMQRQQVSFAVVNDEDGSVSAAYGVVAVPASYVLDASGKVRFVTRGYTSGWGLRLRLWLAGMF